MIPTGARTPYSYDGDGRLLSDVSGTRTIGNNYDLLGRVGCVQDAVPTTNATGACSGGNAYIQNTYDTTKLGTQGSTDFPVGRLTQSIATTYYPESTSATVTEQFQHDVRGRLTNENMQFTLPGGWNVSNPLPTYQLAQSYNDANQLTTTTTSTNPSGQGYTTTQVYDSTTGVLTGLSNNSNATANLATLLYNSRAQLDTINFLTTTGSALAADQYGYDANLRPTSTNATWQSGSGSSGTILSQSVSYDAASNVISLSTTLAGVQGGSGGSETQNFCYDGQNRLIWAGNSGTQPTSGYSTCGSGTLSNSLTGASYSSSYVYTHLGQVWQAPLNNGSTQYQYLYCDSSHPHQLTGLYPLGTTCSNKSGQVYTSGYDAWGNVNNRSYNGTTATLSSDNLHPLVEWNAGSTNQEWYLYDASGNRVLRRSTSGSGTSMIVYAFGLEEHSYTGAGVNQSNTYYYTLAGRLLGAFNGTSTNFFLTDTLGSVLSSFSNVAGSAAVQGNQVYGPYGTQQYQQGNMGTSKGFTGQYNDSTGLDYYGARYYDPVVGRFLSADGANGAGSDPYAYVEANPETLNDPSGQMPCTSTGVCGWPPPPAPPVSGSSGGGITSTLNPVNPGLLNGTNSGSDITSPCLQAGCKIAVLLAVQVVTPVAHRTGTMFSGPPVCLASVFGVPCVSPIFTAEAITITLVRSEVGVPVTFCLPPFPCDEERGNGETTEQSRTEVLGVDPAGDLGDNPAEAGKEPYQNEDGTLVNADKAYIDAENKFGKYLLDPSHPIGKNKAMVYQSALGYNQSNYQGLVEQIQQGIIDNPAVFEKANDYGTQFRVDILVTGPNGNARLVETGWIYEPGTDFPRFLNAIVK